MKPKLLILAVAMLALSACSDKPADASSPAATASAPVDAAPEVEGVRAPAPPPPSGGKAAPEISPEMLAKIREQIAKNPVQAPPAASAQAK